LIEEIFVDEEERGTRNEGDRDRVKRKGRKSWGWGGDI